MPDGSRKTVGGGLRIGWIAARGPVFNRLASLKMATDLNTSPLDQHVATRYLAGDGHDRLLTEARVTYRLRAEALRTALDRHLEGEFDASALDHYEAIVDRSLSLGMAPVVTFNHMTSPHWFAARGGWLDPAAPGLFARYCDRVMAAFGDRIAVAVTLNEPNLPHLLTWMDIPDFVRDLERSTLEAAGKAAGVPRYRLANVMLPEEFDAMADGMEAGHVAARSAIKARRGSLPVGFSLAVVDDQVVGDDPTVRDRKRAEVYGRWLSLASADDYIGVQNYERQYYDAAGPVEAGGMFSGVDARSLGSAVRYAHQATGVPILVTEHGIATEDDARRATFIVESLAGLQTAIDDGVPVLGYIHWTLMDNFEWIFGYGPKLGLHSVDRETFKRTPKPSAAAYAEAVRSYDLG